MNILYVCLANRNRSRTAAEILRYVYKQHQHDSAGTSTYKVNETKKQFPDAKVITRSLLEWANLIVAMDNSVYDDIIKRYGHSYEDKTIILGVPDVYNYMDEEFIFNELIKLKFILGYGYDSEDASVDGAHS